jgi:type II secretory ATPase GspE/PulE/Tfp pilus assembly ATPase PilB-like protein
MAQAFAWDDGAESELSAPFEKKTEEIRLFGHSTHGDGQQARMRPIEGVHVDEILEEGLLRGASDVHIHCGLPPVFRVDGSLVRSDYEPLDARTIQRLVYDILTGEQVGRLEEER